MKPGSMLAIVIFALIAVGHILRLLFGVEMIVGGTVLPMWISVLGIALPTLVAGLLWREARAEARTT